MATSTKKANRLHLLTARQVHTATEGVLSDGGGLELRITSKGAAWVLRFTSPITGKRREMGLGACVRQNAALAGSSLTTARDLAHEAREQLRRGFDPLQARDERRQAERAAEDARRAEVERERWTLQACAKDYYARVIEPNRTLKHSRQWITSLENHIPESLWKAAVDSITAPALLSALLEVKPHERARRHQGDTVPETVRRIRQRLEAIFEDAVFHGRCSSNPAAAIKRKMAETQKREAKGHFAALAYRDAPELMQRIRAMPGSGARALELALLCVARTSEVLNLEWSEIDFEAKIWTVPAARMKLRKGHTVYLSDRAIEVLRAQVGQHDRLVFPSPQKGCEGKPLSNMTLLAVLDRLGVRGQTTAHGLCRATFSTWGNETAAARPDVIEACMSHREQDAVRRAYNRAGFAEDRRRLLQAWADFLGGVTASNVHHLADVRTLAAAA